MTQRQILTWLPEVLMSLTFTRLHVKARGGILPALTLGENIRGARERAGFATQGAAARALGWSQSRLSDLENDRYESLDTMTLLHLAKTFQCSMNDFFIEVDKEYDMVRQRLEQDAVEPGFIDVSGHILDDIPVIAEGEASPQGDLFWDNEGKLQSDVEDRISRPYDVRDPRAYGVKVRGDSMLPAYKPGMVLVVSPNIPVRSGDEVYIQLLSGERLIKIARKTLGGWLLESINPAYEPREVTQTEIGAMHPVLWARRKR